MSAKLLASLPYLTLVLLTSAALGQHVPKPVDDTKLVVKVYNAKVCSASAGKSPALQTPTPSWN